MEAFDPFLDKNISASSKKLYTFNLTKLNNKPLKDLKFLSKTDEILSKINQMKPNTQRTYLISIVSALKGKNEPKYKKLYSKYYEPLETLNKSLKNNTEKTEKVKENWINQNEVLDKLEELKKIIPEIKDKKKINEREYNELLKLVVLSLYALQQPRRNKDYIDMLIVKKIPDNTEYNYLDMDGWNWVFNNYKTKKTYQQQILSINEELKEILKIYFKFHPLAKELKKKNVAVPFLMYHDSPVKTSTDMTRLLNKIFGKKIGCSMLRAIYLTNKYGDSSKELQDDANAMGTSVETAQNNYIKQ